MGKKGFLILGLLIVLLFGALIGFFYLFPALKFKYYYSKLQSADLKEREDAVKSFLELAPEYRRMLQKAALEDADSCPAGAALVFAKSPEFDYKKCEPPGVISFAYAASAKGQRDAFGQNYLNDLGTYLFKIRPSAPNRRYYEALYRFRFNTTGNYRQSDTPFAVLACQQSPDGAWFSEDSTRDGDLRTTALALLAYLGHGNTHAVGEFKRTVRQGLRFLSRRIDGKTGKFSDNTIVHASCAMALAECYAITRDNKVSQLATSSIEHLASKILPDGGFPAILGGNESDDLATCWAVLAIKAAITGGIGDPDNADMTWEEKSEINPYRILTKEKVSGYLAGRLEKNEDYKKAAALGIAAVFCRVRKDEPFILRAADLVAARLPSWGNEFDAEYIYFGSYFLFQIGGDRWEAWKQPLNDTLRGHFDDEPVKDSGSWRPVMGDASRKYGRSFTAAINMLSLEIHDRYARVQKWINSGSKR
jgi:hypothetical protein